MNKKQYTFFPVLHQKKFHYLLAGLPFTAHLSLNVVQQSSLPKHPPLPTPKDTNKQVLLEKILQKQKNKIHHQLQLNAVKKNLTHTVKM